MKKSMKVFLITVSAIVTLAIVATVSLSVMTFMKVSAMESQSSVPDSAGKGNKGEDDVLIGGSYYIRSTKAISDAYLSGDSSALSDRDKETLDMASQVLDEVTSAAMSDYEKEQAVFCWMNENIGGDSQVTVLVRVDVTTDNPHGVLSGRSAVCVGYATTFRLFMQMLDIPCMVVHDTYFSHSWDLVQIGGHWYHVDLYSAHNSSAPLQYLNRTDELQSALGSEWDYSAYPATDSYERCYLCEQAVKSDDIYAVPAALKSAIGEQRDFLSLLIPSRDDAASVSEYLLSNLEARLMGSVEYQYYYFTHAVVPMNDDTLLVYIMIEGVGDDSGDDFDLSEELIEKADQAINGSFGDLTDIVYDDADDFAW